MPLFDDRTTSIINTILVEGTTPKSTYTFKKTKKSKGTGGYGVGGPKIDSGKKPVFNKPWTGTEPAPGTVIVPGGNIPRQATWGKLKYMVDPTVDYYFDATIDAARSVPVAGAAAAAAAKFAFSPAVRFATKQIVKTDLAKRYLGLGGLASKAAALPGKMMLGKDAEGVIDTASSWIMSQIPGAAEFTGNKPQFGILGKKVGDKLGDIAKMGIDPLDWVTKAFGADQAASHVENIGGAQSLGTTTAAGYLGRGKRSGIY